MASRSTDYRIDPFDLQLFEAVVEHGSITAGAQAMSLSLAAASERLKTLEHRVGVQLFERSKAGTLATDAGRALSRQAHRVLAELDSLHATMTAFGQGLRGTVRLLCITAAMAEALPPQLGRFLAQHPDIDVELQEMSSIDALHGLRSGAAEVAIVANHVDTSGLTTHHWLDHELVALLPAGRKAPVAIRYADLLDRPFVGLDADAGLSRFLQQHAARSGRVPHHRIRVRSFDAIARLVETGAGVAVMPHTSAERWMTPGLHVARLLDPWAKRRMLLCHTAQALELFGVRALIEALTPG
jgi:molybdate transport repressor ModE-like protein